MNEGAELKHGVTCLRSRQIENSLMWPVEHALHLNNNYNTQIHRSDEIIMLSLYANKNMTDRLVIMQQPFGKGHVMENIVPFVGLYVNTDRLIWFPHLYI